MAKLISTGIEFGTTDQINTRRWIFQGPSDPGGANQTAWVFYQDAAPTYWAKSTTHNDKALRLVSGDGGGSGGTHPFTTIMSNFNVGGALGGPFSTGGVGYHPITFEETPYHNHAAGGAVGLAENAANYNPDGAFTGWAGGDVGRAGGWTRTSPNTGDTTPTATRDGGHSHPFTASATVPNQNVAINVKYIDVIICTFNG